MWKTFEEICKKKSSILFVYILGPRFPGPVAIFFSGVRRQTLRYETRIDAPRTFMLSPIKNRQRQHDGLVSWTMLR